MKPYRTIPIKECGEPLLAIPEGLFRLYEPHTYVAAGAPYDGVSPWMLRQSVLEALKRVQDNLSTRRPGWKILLFDAYRPFAVQAYMVERELNHQAKLAGLDPSTMTTVEREELLMKKVFRIWGEPNDDPAYPPAHSTGAVVDLTFADAKGSEVDMGSPIDENSDRSNPDYFANATDIPGQTAHANRVLLKDLMLAEGFCQLRDEWWHFSMGEQYWAWLQREENPASMTVSRFGRADLLK